VLGAEHRKRALRIRNLLATKPAEARRTRQHQQRPLVLLAAAGTAAAGIAASAGIRRRIFHPFSLSDVSKLKRGN